MFSFSRRYWRRTTTWLDSEAEVLNAVVQQCRSPEFRRVLKAQIDAMTEVERDRTASGYTATLYGHADCEFFGYSARFVIAEAVCTASDIEFTIQLISPAGRLAYVTVSGPVPYDLRKLHYTDVQVTFVDERTGYPVPLKGWVKKYIDRGVLIPGHPPLPKAELEAFAKDHPYLPDDYLELLAYFNGCGIDRREGEAWIEGAGISGQGDFALSDGRRGYTIVNLGEEGSLMVFTDTKAKEICSMTPWAEPGEHFATSLRSAIDRLVSDDDE